MARRHLLSILGAAALVGGSVLATAPAYAQGDGGGAGAAGGAASAGAGTAGSQDGSTGTTGSAGASGTGTATGVGSTGGTGPTSGGSLPQGPLGGPTADVGIGTAIPDPAQRGPQTIMATVTGYPLTPPVVSTVANTFLEPPQDPPLNRAIVGFPTGTPREIVMGPRGEEAVIATIPAALRGNAAR